MVESRQEKTQSFDFVLLTGIHGHVNLHAYTTHMHTRTDETHMKIGSLTQSQESIFEIFSIPSSKQKRAR